MKQATHEVLRYTASTGVASDDQCSEVFILRSRQGAMLTLSQRGLPAGVLAAAVCAAGRGGKIGGRPGMHAGRQGSSVAARDSCRSRPALNSSHRAETFG